MPRANMLDLSDGPFVLLEGESRSRLFRAPAAVIEARRPEDVSGMLSALRAHLGQGGHVAGFVGYEASAALVDKLSSHAACAAEDAPPLAWFGLFDAVEEIAAETLPALLPDPQGAWASAPRPLISATDHACAVARIKEHIAAGDIYQANLTFAAEVRTMGNPLALYAGVRERARAGHGGIVHTGAHTILSWSPELFFEAAEGRVTARPMKGTAPRGRDAAEDERHAAALASDPKQRAENLMIVDLIRNDLSRLARPGTVAVPKLFAVERYPTVLQLTSTVTAELEDGHDAIHLLASAFPCGSVTGAPKIRAMEIIRAVETRGRGVYTGSIGQAAPDGRASFNVAIRTLVLRSGEETGIMGLGSGIVADSEAAAEWAECLQKGKFVESAAFDLIETMRFDPREGIIEIDRHLARMKASAEALGFSFNRHDARNELQAATFRLSTPSRLRLRLSPGGATAIETRSLPPTPAEPVTLALAQLPVARDDFRLRHKTSDRAFYDAARRASGAFEVAFVDPDGFVTEGSFTSIFVKRGGMLLTPPQTRAPLPGTLRARLLAEGKAREAELRGEDLRGGCYIGNAVRGLIRARLVSS